jgi:DNA-directed RNA polymerase specialized sigma24 family protein
MQAPLNPYAQIEGHELFRRAIVEGDEMAWSEGIRRYRTLLVYWASRSAAKASIGECGDDIADQAISRAWTALSTACFDRFPNLAAILAYLRACVASAVIDCARGQQAAERLAQAFELPQVATPEEIAIERHDRQALWQIVLSNVQNEQERVVLVEMFVYALPPRTIVARYPHLFASAHDVYNAKRNVFERLKRCPELRRLYAEC